MEQVMNKETIMKESEKIFQRMYDYCRQLPDETFFGVPEGKWTIAQHVQHLVISTKMSTAAFAIPKFLVSLIGGKPDRPSMNFYDFTEKYQLKLKEGGKASGRYIPSNVNAVSGKAVLVKWQKTTSHYLRTIDRNWKEDQLDNYFVLHPLLAKITLRELCYFTVHHTDHHLRGIKRQALLF